MYLERLADAQAYANAAIASMARHGIAPNPQNFAIWYEYHTGQNADLRRMIDIIVSNRREFDERMLHELYEDYFTSTKEELALHGISVRVQDTLHEVLGLVDTAHTDATHYGAALDDVFSGQLLDDIGPLATLLQRLVTEAQEMARRSERLGHRLKQSVQTIRTLENTLDDVRREATTDGLTGIANRRAFDTILRETAAEAMNSGDELSMLIIDIDHFKKFNDTWGHQAGDDVLRIIAATLQQTIRGQDTAARYGGEEFAVILPATTLEAAVAVGNNIRRACEKRQLVTGDAQTPIDPITVSIGAACYDPGEALTNWVRRADTALYRAKEGGRNRVVCE
jgi:diguanylate cyclase